MKSIKMKNNFADAMSKRTDEELTKIVNSSSDDYQPEAVKAAEQEIIKRKFAVDKLSDYSDEQILKILKSQDNYQKYEIKAVEIEAKKRNIEFSLEKEKAEMAMQEEIEKLQTEVNKERYPALRFISGFYKILAWVVCLLSVGFLIYLILGEAEMLTIIGTLIGGGILFISLLAIGEGIKVFIDIERNTRIAATNSKKMSLLTQNHSAYEILQ